MSEEEKIVWEEFPTYTESELDEFSEWLQQFRVKHTIIIFGKEKQVSFIDEKQAAVAFGALRKTMYLGHPHHAVIMRQVEKATGQRTAQYVYPSKYDTFQDKLKQLRRLQWMRGKREEKKVEGLEELARGMSV